VRIDPAATLAPYPIDVDVGEFTVTIPALPASAWLAALIRGAVTDLVPGLVDGDTLDDPIADGLIDGAELLAAARAALAAAAGSTWWAASTLAVEAAGSGLHAELLLHGLDPAVMSLGAYLAAALHVATRGVPQEKRDEIHWLLDRPPAGVDPGEWFDEDEAAAGFMAAIGSTGDDGSGEY
jgi:hypothetical protein